MIKKYSYTEVHTTYEYEFIKESFNQFLATLCIEIKNRLGENVQIVADSDLKFTCNNKKVAIEHGCGRHIKYAMVEYRYDEKQPKVCERVIITFGA